MYKPRIIDILPNQNKIFNGVNAIQVARSRRENSRNPIHFLRVYLNFAYFFCYIPFRFVKSSNGTYNIHSNIFHQIACGVNHILALSRFLTAIRETSLLEESHWNPSVYFELARSFATSIYMAIFILTFWTKKKLFHRIFLEIQQYYFRYRSTTTTSGQNIENSWRLRVTTTGWILCILYTLISTLNVIFGAGMIEMSSWELKWLLQSYAGQGKFMFFLQSNKSAVKWENFSPSVYAFTTLQIIIQFYFKLGAHYADLCILMCTLTLRNLATHFSVAIKFENFSTFQMLDHYYVLKKLARCINSAIGPITLCAILEAMPYYATHLGDILFIPWANWWGKFRYIFFVVNFFSILIMAADTAFKVGDFKEWLSLDRNCCAIPQNKLIILLSELKENAVGLSAMGFLTITYGFIGTLVSVIVTYAVIILQFKSSVVNCGPPQLVDSLGGD